MKKFNFTLILILVVNIGFSQSEKRTYTTIRVKDAPIIDGLLNDEVWKNVPIASDMLQLNPNEGQAATKKTDVKVIYDDKAIYAYAMLYDSSPDSIRKELGNRDDGSINADAFYIGFDPYNQLNPYVFGVTASGVQLDYTDSDPTYDAVWESAVKINDQGWAVEIRIPYSAIRFPSKENQEWLFQFTRSIKRSGEYDQFALTPKTASNSRLFWGKIVGLSNIKAPLRLSFTPFVTAYAENAPYYDANQNLKYGTSVSYNAGADIKYGIDDRFTLDLTLLPDFSQVQSDNKIKNLSYQEVTYNENRPFFKEGTDLFNKNELFYSRRIGKTPSNFYALPYMINQGDAIIENPSNTKLINAIKISGRNDNGLGIGFFNAITDNTYAVIEDSTGNRRKIMTEPLTNYNVIVFDQKLKNNSSVFLINTNVIRNGIYDDANVTGSGFTLNNKKNSYAIDAFGVLSQKFQTVDTIQDNYNAILGYKYFIGARKSSGNFQFGLSHYFINKNYDSKDLGYYVIGNKMSEKIYISYNTYKPNKIFRETYNTLSFYYTTNPESKKTISSQMYLSLYGTFLNYSNLSISAAYTPFITYDYNEPRVDGWYSRAWRYFYMTADYQSDARKKLTINAHVEGGNFIERFSGIGYGTSLGALFRINKKMQIRYNFYYAYDSYNIGFADFDENYNIVYGGRRLITFENNLTMQYLFKNDMSINLISRHYNNTGEYLKYYSLQTDGDIIENSTYNGNRNFNYNAFNIDLAFTWQFAPGSLISLVYKNAIDAESPIIYTNYYKNFSQTFNSPQINSISLKILYYLDYQKLKKSKNV
ncbi:MAG: carbohydrate binding family 9 domain-containing protein [Bacteroidetes bacterium]|nr:carbohydrate binding family 9 domain-containing protein [Bacteroidota bacterium]